MAAGRTPDRSCAQSSWDEDIPVPPDSIWANTSPLTARVTPESCAAPQRDSSVSTPQHWGCLSRAPGKFRGQGAILPLDTGGSQVSHTRHMLTCSSGEINFTTSPAVSSYRIESLEQGLHIAQLCKMKPLLYIHLTTRTSQIKMSGL